MTTIIITTTFPTNTIKIAYFTTTRWTTNVIIANSIAGIKKKENNIV